LSQEDCNGCEFRDDLLYDDEYQIWVAVEEAAVLRIGMTDLSQTIAGRILHVRVRRPGTVRPRGKPVATLESGKWAGPVPNVFDCEIIEGNRAVLEDPSLLNRDPYGHWIARVKPLEPLDVIRGRLVSGERAREGYCERARREDIHCKRLDD